MTSACLVEGSPSGIRKIFDTVTVVYRVLAQRGTAYFLKLRKGFTEIVVTVPLFLRSQGIQEIIIPFETKTKRYWADFGEYKMILYPFVEGKNRFDMDLSDRNKRRLGRTLKAIHGVQVPPELQRLIPQESFSPQWRESLKSLQARVEETSFQDPTSAKLAAFMKTRRKEIDRLIERAEDLASVVQSQPLEMVLCHTDIHGANMLIRTDGWPPVFYIVDWDAPLLAPKERDLMFIGGGVGHVWNQPREEALFYEGYGPGDLDLVALAYKWRS